MTWPQCEPPIAGMRTIDAFLTMTKRDKLLWAFIVVGSIAVLVLTILSLGPDQPTRFTHYAGPDSGAVVTEGAPMPFPAFTHYYSLIVGRQTINGHYLLERLRVDGGWECSALGVDGGVVGIDCETMTVLESSLQQQADRLCDCEYGRKACLKMKEDSKRFDREAECWGRYWGKRGRKPDDGGPPDPKICEEK
jgi:hypothetical protein